MQVKVAFLEWTQGPEEFELVTSGVKADQGEVRTLQDSATETPAGQVVSKALKLGQKQPNH